MLQHSKESTHVIRQCSHKCHPLTADRMIERQLAGMQGLPRESLHHLLPCRVDVLGQGRGAGPIEPVPDQGVAKMGQMHTDLMGAASLEMAPDVGTGGRCQ